MYKLLSTGSCKSKNLEVDLVFGHDKTIHLGTLGVRSHTAMDLQQGPFCVDPASGLGFVGQSSRLLLNNPSLL